MLERGSVAQSTAVKYALMRAFLWAMPARTRTNRVRVPDWMPPADRLTEAAEPEEGSGHG